ncbi:MAG TPA: molybdate ABC transporter substrate-binding protein [Micromonosporaceae bacterium]|nr:molybdate ABC transporter substrate-binding protein [Micromonosporaceae bacterium]
MVTGASCAGPGAAEPGGTRRLTVLAAASLTEPFSEIGAAFEAAHPGVRVDFSFAGSSQLAQQIRAGAPADVFAAASQATMRTVTDAGDAAGQPQVFARNQLVIAVPQGNPRGIRALDDLAVAGAKVALCAPQVPCGAATRQVLDNAGVNVTPVTLEKDVRAALSKLRLGEVDAALVYRSETVAAAAEVEAVEFAESDGAVNDYPIVVLAGAPNSADAQRFVAYVLSEPGRRILTTAGFQRP